MPVGRKPKSTVLKLVSGNPGKRPLNDAEPQPVVLVDLTSPKSLDSYGRQCWNRNAPVLQGIGILTEADVDLLTLYCDAYSQWRRASIAVRRLKPTDDLYRRVAVSVERARDQMRLLASELGLSPSSRSRLSVGTGASDVDPMEELLSGRNRAS